MISSQQRNNVGYREEVCDGTQGLVSGASNNGAMDNQTNREAILSCDTADQLQDQSGQT
jgi:hypothetical protein